MGINVGQTARSLPSYVAVNVSVNHENTCTNIKAIHIKGSDDSLPCNKQRFDEALATPLWSLLGRLHTVLAHVIMERLSSSSTATLYFHGLHSTTSTSHSSFFQPLPIIFGQLFFSAHRSKEPTQSLPSFFCAVSHAIG